MQINRASWVCAAVCLLTFSLHAAFAESYKPIGHKPITQLGIDADRCAIFHALTGNSASDCAPAQTHRLGQAKRLPPAGFDTDAAPLAAPGSETGYFIRFPFNSDQLTPEYNAHLRRLSDVLASPALQNSCVKLVGHADSVGGDRYNRTLSAARAKMVAAFLVGNGAISMDRITTEAQGEAQLLPNVPGPHPLNRRVEILARKKHGTTCG